MAIEKVIVPDIGDYKDVNVIGVNVKVGDNVNAEDSLITLETDKAVIEVPSPFSGVVKEINIDSGCKVSEGSLILSLNTISSASNADLKSDKNYLSPPNSVLSELKSIKKTQNMVNFAIPDIGDYKDVNVIEVNAKVGDSVNVEDSLITLETDKASIEIPAPQSGIIAELKIKVGDKVSSGDPFLVLQIPSNSKHDVPLSKNEPQQQKYLNETISNNNMQLNQEEKISYIKKIGVQNSKNVYASPAVRRLASTLCIDLTSVNPTGRKGRITKEDCKKYVKESIKLIQSNNKNTNLDFLPEPKIDFTKFGEVQFKSLSRINIVSAKNLARNWIKIPHVTFHDQADITDLETFRKSKKSLAEKLGIKLTILSFLIKVTAFLLKEYPQLNSSLSHDGKSLIIKKYFNIGFAVDTAKGLLVPVVKNADKKSILEIAKEIIGLSRKSRAGTLSSTDIQGGTFSISSLGSLGTNSFTPIINMPEVAIIGISKSTIKPIWNGKEFLPRVMLPISLSADHRVVDGALASKFLTRYCSVLGDIKEILL